MNLDRRLLDFIHSSQIAFFLTILIGFMIGVCIVLQARMLSSIVDQVFLNAGTLNDVANSIFFLLTIIFLRAALGWIGEISANQVATTVKLDLHNRLFTHIQSIGPAKIKNQQEYSTGKLTNIIVEGVESLDSYFRYYLPQLVLAAIVPIICLIFVYKSIPFQG